jgi:xylulokinase
MYVLAFDIGTSAIKSSLVSPKGQIIDSASWEYGVGTPARNQVEQDPDLWWTGACTVSAALKERNPVPYREIAVVGVCGHMLGCLPVDSEGNALRPAIIHADTRAIAETKLVSECTDVRELYRSTGCILSAQSSLSKILWLRHNEPDIYKKTSRFLQSKDYLTAKLTGNIDSTDFSDASHAQLIDIHKKTYLTDLFAELSLDRQKFPEIYRGTDIAGKVTGEAARCLGISAGIPVIAGGGDGACASIGAGITTSGGELYCCIGTTAWIACNSTTPVLDEKFRLFTIMSLDGTSFGLFGTMQAAGKCIDWIQELFSIESSHHIDTEAAMAQPGSDDLVFLPYIDGERSPIFDANARGLFFNISANHGRPHFCRSVLEGVSFALRSILEVYREKKPISQMRVIGGGAASRFWLQILANVCGTNILLVNSQANSATSLGVALAAATGVGMYNSLDEAAAAIDITGTIGVNHDTFLVYQRLFDTFLHLYPQIKCLFGKDSDPAFE